MEMMEALKKKIYLINGKPLLVMFEDIFFPTLFFEEYVNRLPKVTVDMGAVPHICNGADIMAPGILEVNGDFKEKAFVIVIDERHKHPLAVAQSLFNSEKTRTLRRGKVFKNLHYVGDEIWNLTKSHASG